MPNSEEPMENIYETIIVNGKPLGQCTNEDLLQAAEQEREAARKLLERAEMWGRLNEKRRGEDPKN